MSRDRLAAMRAQQAAQRMPARAQVSQQDSYDDGRIPMPLSGNEAPYGNEQYYGHQERVNDTLNEIPEPPDYSQPFQSNSTSRSNNYGNGNGAYIGNGPQVSDTGDAEDARGHRATDQRRRRPSQGAAAYEQDNRQQRQQGQNIVPSVPSNHEIVRQRQPPRQQQPQSYGERMDDSAYYEKNASQLALNQSYEDNYSEKYKGYPPQSGGKQRNLTSYQANPQSYTIPVLPKNDQRQDSRAQQAWPPASLASPNLSSANVTSNAPVVDMADFFEEIGSIREAFKDLENHISYLDQLHSRNLSGNGSEEVVQELQSTANQTRKLTNVLRNRIKALQELTRIRTHGQAEQDRQTRKIQIGAVRERFLETVQNYQNMEMRNRDKAKMKIERQFQIVKPNATQEEVREVVEGGQEVQVFAQALQQSNRVGNARGVLNEVQNRHEDIKKIEQTLVELFQLFQDMAIMVEEQDEQLIHVEQKAEEVAKDMEVGHVAITQAVVSAKGARRKRKICCAIMFIFLLIVGAVIAYVVVKIVVPKVNANKAASAQKANTTTTGQAKDTSQTPIDTIAPANDAASGLATATTGSNGDTGAPASPMQTVNARGYSDLLD